MKQDAIEFGYKCYTFCQAKKELLALNGDEEVICLFSDCNIHNCPFEANVAHGEEIAFLKKVKGLLLNLSKTAIPQT